MTLEAVEEIRRQFDLPEFSASVFRRNLIVAGIDLASLVGQRFEIQGVVFEGTQECTPCRWMDRVVVEGVREFMKHNFRGGLRAKILSDGFLTCDHVHRKSADVSNCKHPLP